MVVVGVVLGVLLAASAVSLLRPGPGAVLLVTAAGAAWWLVDGPVEGPVLLVVTPTHGLTVADLLVPPLVATAVVAALRSRRDAAGRRPDAAAPRGRD